MFKCMQGLKRVAQTKQECRELAHEDNFLVHTREAGLMLLNVTEVGTPQQILKLSG